MIPWARTWLQVAQVISERSHDPDTAHGAVIVDAQNIVLGVGYNGLPRGGNDYWFPRTRPAKHLYILQAEINALLNCQRRPTGGIMYVTGHPCPQCLVAANNAGIFKVVYGPRESAIVDEEAKEAVRRIVTYAPIQIEAISEAG